MSRRPRRSSHASPGPLAPPVRVGPSPYHEQLASLACGEVGYVVARRDGWVEVSMATSRAGSARHTSNWEDQRRRRHRTGARVPPVGSQATASAPAGCASLRARPASYAVERACVEDGQEVEIVSGPFDPDGRDAWFEVWRPSKGPGWMLGDYLFAV